MDTRRYTETEWRTMAVAMLRDASRRQDWRLVEAAQELLERKEVNAPGMQALLIADSVEADWQAMEVAFDAWLVASGRTIGAGPLGELIEDAWGEEYEDAAGETHVGAELYEYEPNSGLLLTLHRTWELLENSAMWDARGTMWEGHGAAREYPIDAFYDAMRRVCQELFTDRILARERKHNPALLRA